MKAPFLVAVAALFVSFIPDVLAHHEWSVWRPTLRDFAQKLF